MKRLLLSFLFLSSCFAMDDPCDSFGADLGSPSKPMKNHGPGRNRPRDLPLDGSDMQTRSHQKQQRELLDLVQSNSLNSVNMDVFLSIMENLPPSISYKPLVSWFLRSDEGPEQTDIKHLISSWIPSLIVPSGRYQGPSIFTGYSFSSVVFEKGAVLSGVSVLESEDVTSLKIRSSTFPSLKSLSIGSEFYRDDDPKKRFVTFSYDVGRTFAVESISINGDEVLLSGGNIFGDTGGVFRGEYFPQLESVWLNGMRDDTGPDSPRPLFSGAFPNLEDISIDYTSFYRRRLTDENIIPFPELKSIYVCNSVMNYGLGMTAFEQCNKLKVVMIKDTDMHKKIVLPKSVKNLILMDVKAPGLEFPRGVFDNLKVRCYQPKGELSTNLEHLRNQGVTVRETIDGDTSSKEDDAIGKRKQPTNAIDESSDDVDSEKWGKPKKYIKKG